MTRRLPRSVKGTLLPTPHWINPGCIMSLGINSSIIQPHFYHFAENIASGNLRESKPVTGFGATLQNLQSTGLTMVARTFTQSWLSPSSPFSSSSY